MKKTFGLWMIFCSFFVISAEKTVFLNTKEGSLEGTLIYPEEKTSYPLALLIAGSGPTDRNGNQVNLRNNSLKYLAESLLENGIAVLRYDKRGIGNSSKAGLKEEDLRFEHFAMDAKGWIDKYKGNKSYSSIVVIGHSEGAQIGLLVAKYSDKYISLSGIGSSADKILKKQLSKQPEYVKKPALRMIQELKSGLMIEEVPPFLNALFRPSVQPYMISWFNNDPLEEIKKLTIPILIVNGSNDLQVPVSEAELLRDSAKNAQYFIVPNMNHILKISSMDAQENFNTYNNLSLPVSSILVDKVTEFILE